MKSLFIVLMLVGMKSIALPVVGNKYKLNREVGEWSQDGKASRKLKNGGAVELIEIKETSIGGQPGHVLYWFKDQSSDMKFNVAAESHAAAEKWIKKHLLAQ